MVLASTWIKLLLFRMFQILMLSLSKREKKTNALSVLVSRKNVSLFGIKEKKYILQSLLRDSFKRIAILSLYNHHCNMWFLSSMLQFMELENAMPLLQCWMDLENFQKFLLASRPDTDWTETQNDAMVIYDK